MTKYIQPRLAITPAREIAQLKEQNGKLIAEIKRLETEAHSCQGQTVKWIKDYQACAAELDMRRARGDELARLLTNARKWSAAWKLSCKMYRTHAKIHRNAARIMRERMAPAAIKPRSLRAKAFDPPPDHS